MRKLDEYEFFKKEEGGTWPVLKPFGAGSVFSGPSQMDVEKYCNVRFQEVSAAQTRHASDRASLLLADCHHHPWAIIVR